MTAWAAGSPTGCTNGAAEGRAARWFSGLTFKENVPDLRNSRAFDLIARLAELGHERRVADPLADPGEVRARFRLAIAEADGRPLRSGGRGGRP